jgi:hypothetical protein
MYISRPLSAIVLTGSILSAIGCSDPDHHPSQMVRMRDQQRAQQKASMNGGPPDPATIEQIRKQAQAPKTGAGQ